MGHENAEGMAHVGVRVERPVRRKPVHMVLCNLRIGTIR